MFADRHFARKIEFALLALMLGVEVSGSCSL